MANTDTRLRIDDAFIATWHPKYEETENDEEEYKTLVDQAAKDVRLTNTLSRESFWAIYKWKGAMRVKRYVDDAQYESMYSPAFRNAALAAPENKLKILLAPSAKLPGLGAPTASTILHFIHPDMMPIIDRRTAEVLHRARLVLTKGTGFRHYEGFRSAIDSIRLRCPEWTLRQIDRALFAFQKLNEARAARDLVEIPGELSRQKAGRAARPTAAPCRAGWRRAGAAPTVTRRGRHGRSC